MAKKIILVFLLLMPAAFANPLERLFYLTYPPNKNHLSSEQAREIKSHAAAIDIIAPQIYELDKNGKIHGKIDNKLITICSQSKLKLMPLVVNVNFNENQIHLFLLNKKAQWLTIQKLRSLALNNHFYGFQFDIENIAASDKLKFNDFYLRASHEFHRNGLAISITLVPPVDLLTPFNRWFYRNWSGAYDAQILAKNSDFITIMAYDLHTSLTTPGPIAPIDWVKRVLKNLLKIVPANKISLGIPVYSGYWSTGELKHRGIPEEYTFRSKETPISYSRAVEILQHAGQSLNWQRQWQSSYAFFEDDNRLDYLFVEDARSFQAKYRLAQRYHLRGVSVWKLGMEDARIWAGF